jgi:hypothetical protein
MSNCSILFGSDDSASKKRGDGLRCRSVVERMHNDQSSIPRTREREENALLESIQNTRSNRNILFAMTEIAVLFPKEAFPCDHRRQMMTVISVALIPVKYTMVTVRTMEQ